MLHSLRFTDARMRHPTSRHVPRELADALDAEKRRRGTSLNRAVLDAAAELDVRRRVEAAAAQCQRSSSICSVTSIAFSTSVNSARGEEVAEQMDGADWIRVPSIVVGELLGGFAAGCRNSRSATDLEECPADPVVEELPVGLRLRTGPIHPHRTADPAVEELPVGREVARIHARLVSSLRSAGTPLPTSDARIAATAAPAGARLRALDRHFRQIARAGTILLQPEPAEN